MAGIRRFGRSDCCSALALANLRCLRTHRTKLCKIKAVQAQSVASNLPLARQLVSTAIRLYEQHTLLLTALGPLAPSATHPVLAAAALVSCNIPSRHRLVRADSNCIGRHDCFHGRSKADPEDIRRILIQIPR